MKREQPYCLFFDFDDTVFVDRQIPPENRNAMQAAQKAGHSLILNTGRSFGGLIREPAANEIPWDGMILGAGDIRFHGKILSQNRLPFDLLFAWLEYCMDRHFTLGYGGEKTFIRLSFREYDGPVPSTEREKARALLLREMSECENYPTKISIYEKSCLFDRKKLPSAEKDIVFHEHFVEVYAPGCDKGSAILQFCKLQNISVSRCVCFGDSLNDYAMFQVCPISVCMDISHPALKDISTYCAKTEYGVAEGLSWLLDEKRD